MYGNNYFVATLQHEPIFAKQNCRTYIPNLPSASLHVAVPWGLPVRGCVCSRARGAVLAGLTGRHHGLPEAALNSVDVCEHVSEGRRGF